METIQRLRKSSIVQRGAREAGSAGSRRGTPCRARANRSHAHLRVTPNSATDRLHPMKQPRE
eukprot:scaffold116590_cov69-Phaeocystis_antarctica.AAC.2